MSDEDVDDLLGGDDEDEVDSIFHICYQPAESILTHIDALKKKLFFLVLGFVTLQHWS